MLKFLLNLRTIRFIRGKYFSWRIKRSVMVLEGLDGMLMKAGYRRHERRQFWREFQNHQAARDKVWERLEK